MAKKRFSAKKELQKYFRKMQVYNYGASKSYYENMKAVKNIAAALRNSGNYLHNNSVIDPFTGEERYFKNSKEAVEFFGNLMSREGLSLKEIGYELKIGTGGTNGQNKNTKIG